MQKTTPSYLSHAWPASDIPSAHGDVFLQCILQLRRVKKSFWGIFFYLHPFSDSDYSFLSQKFTNEL